MFAVSTVYPEWVDKVKMGYQDDPLAMQYLVDPHTDAPKFKGFCVSDGLIRQYGRIWLGTNKLAQSHVIQAVHSSGVGGYSRVLPTYHRIKQLFIWPNM